MISEKANQGRTLFIRVEIEQVCPDCGSTLKIVEQTNENGVSFIWYKCSRPDCSGQWLERRIAAIKDYCT